MLPRGTRKKLPDFERYFGVRRFDAAFLLSFEPRFVALKERKKKESGVKAPHSKVPSPQFHESGSYFSNIAKIQSMSEPGSRPAIATAPISVILFSHALSTETADAISSWRTYLDTLKPAYVTL